jgi:hypothetical protein
VIPHDGGHPRWEQRVHGTRDGALRVAEAPEKTGQRARPLQPDLQHVARVVVRCVVEPVVVTVAADDDARAHRTHFVERVAGAGERGGRGEAPVSMAGAGERVG